MRGLSLALLIAVLLTACATVAPPPSGGDSSLVVGRLKVEVSGVGTATNGSDGFVYTDQAAGAAVIVQNETSGKTYEIRTATPSDFFLLANAEPGTYRLLKLWALIKTGNSYVNIASTFYKNVAFEVKPGRVANLGVTTWKFSFDLTRSVSSTSFAFNADFPAAEKALSHADPRWSGREIDQMVFSGETAAHPSADALQPRNTGNGQMLMVP
jgi:hypothetical protein